MNFDLSREWLVSNGIGGFACSTVVGCNTRRYHALLCAATRPPLGRMVLVNKADETLTIGGRSFDLGCNQYPGTLHPTGFRYLSDFTLSPLPTWTYEVPGATLRKTLWMPHGTNATVVRYELLKGDCATLSAHPFITGRDYHGTHRYNTDFNANAVHNIDESGCHVSLRPYADCPDIVLSHEGEWYPAGAWYYSFEYAIEQERGLDFVEDAYCPGAWVWQLNRDKPVADLGHRCARA
jgi:predicted glycogen debranching enzyme